MYLGNLHWLDVIVIALYYVGTLALGIWTICKTKNSLNSFFLGGRSMTWWPIGMSIFASNIGSINFVGIAGTAAASGLAVVMFEWSAVFLLVLLGWVFIPVYLVSGIYTIPEFLHVRFGGQRLRVYLSIIAMLTYVFAIMSVDLYSGAIFIQHTVGTNLYIGVAIILATAVLFTILGGLRTVVFTDAFAVVIMLSGGLLLFILGMIKVGGMSQLRTMYMSAIPNVTLPNSTCGYPKEDAWHIFRNSLSTDLPGLGTFLRTTLGSLWFWCSNQLIVQRSLGAKNIMHAKGACVFAAVLKLSPMIIMVLPGMMSRALYPNEIACATPEICEQVCHNPAGCSNIAYPKLAMELLPHGLRGLLISAMIAAVISSLTSIFNSSSSLITIDVWKRIRPSATEREMLLVGKVFVAILTVTAVAWIPTMDNAEGGQIYKYAQATVGLFGGPTCGLFLCAIFIKMVNERGAFWGIIIGQIWGLTRFILDIIFPAPICGQEDTRPIFLKYWHVYYHVVSQILLTVVLSVILSLILKEKTERNLNGVTFWTRSLPRANQDSPSNSDYELASFTPEMVDKDAVHDKIIDGSDHDGLEEKDIEVRLTVKNRRKDHRQCCSQFSNLCFSSKSSDVSKKDNDMVNINHLLKEHSLWKIILNILAALITLTTVLLYIYFR